MPDTKLITCIAQSHSVIGFVMFGAGLVYFLELRHKHRLLISCENCGTGLHWRPVAIVLCVPFAQDSADRCKSLILEPSLRPVVCSNQGCHRVASPTLNNNGLSVRLRILSMSRLLRAMVLLGMLLSAHDAWAQKLRLAGDAWAPYADVSLLNGGLSIDLIRTALGRAGYTTEYEQVPWARAIHGVGEGRYDILINAWYSEDRTHIGQFSGEYLINRLRFLKRKSSTIDYQNLPQLHPYSIAVVRSYAYSPEFDADTELKKVLVASFSTAARMLAAGRVELTVEDEYAARFALSREPDDVRNNVEFLPKSLSENSLHILVSLKNPDHARIVADFDKAIAAMKADGTYEQLFKLHGL